MSRALDFIGVSLNPLHARNVAAWTQFKNLKQQEAHSGFPEAPQGDNHQPFFRAGRMDQWQGVLTEAQIARLVNASEQGMNRLGFPVPGQPPIRRAC